MNLNTRIGILGGGQLGKMMLQAGSRWNLDLWVMDKAFDYPAAKVTSQFVQADFKDYDPVYQFGKHVDIVTIEIEAVNTEALKKLEEEGKDVFPSAKTIDIIKDKGLQKSFYKTHQIPTSPFKLYDSAQAIRDAVAGGSLPLPFVQKSRTEGYDGRGVHIVRSEKDLDKLLPVASVVEDMVNIKKEIAVQVARNVDGDIVVYPPVEMHFHPTANLVDYILCPSTLTNGQQGAITQLAKALVIKLDMVGIMAIELFLSHAGEIIVNEIAPRPHNSGHHTIENNHTSQFEQHLRAILNAPLGSTEILHPAVMINLLGEPGYQGDPFYQGLEACLKMDDVFVHIYGKAETKPYRKMGHVTVLGRDLEQALEKAKFVQQTLKVIT